MSYLENKDTEKEYFPEKIWQEMKQREDDNGNFYYYSHDSNEETADTSRC